MRIHERKNLSNKLNGQTIEQKTHKAITRLLIFGIIFLVIEVIAMIIYLVAG
ncbi:hypothetical protein LCGC14_0337600 [marine sediment metagenome]|uniref:Uncharacterized protein n=1 Tax=marine sediment metagenome TaxID=412755 RepID=A0A0F9WMB0_9ZZZZ